MEKNERLKVAREASGYASASAAAKAIGINYQTYAGHENAAKGSFRTEDAIRYAKFFRVRLEWLLTGKGAMRDHDAPETVPRPQAGAAALVQVDGEAYAKLPLYDIRAQAGKGALAYDGEPIGWRLFDFNFIKTIARSSLDQLKVIEVSGDSMEPTLYRGDHVLVDLGDVSLGRHGLFVLRLDESLVVKRVQKTFKTGAVRVISDNPKYATEEIDEPDALIVIGRVIWLGRSVG